MVVLNEGSYLTLTEVAGGTIEDVSVDKKATVKIDGEDVSLATLAELLMEDVSEVPGETKNEAKYIPLTNGNEGEYNLYALGTPYAESGKAKILRWAAAIAAGTTDNYKFRFMPNFADKDAYTVLKDYAKRLSNDDKLDENANFQVCFEVCVNGELQYFWSKELKDYTSALTFSSGKLKDFGELNEPLGSRACFYVTLKGLGKEFSGSLTVTPFLSVDGQRVIDGTTMIYVVDPS